MGGLRHAHGFGAGYNSPDYHPPQPFTLGYGGAFPLAAPYYFTPPQLVGSWEMPKTSRQISEGGGGESDKGGDEGADEGSD
jgi:hypothetical protein